MNTTKNFRNMLLPLAAGTLLAACGGGSSGSVSGDFLVTDGPADDLLSFRATVTEIRLEKSGLGESGNVLPSPVELEFLGLENSFSWLASGTVAPSTYDAVRLVFEPGSYVARDMTGALVEVTALADELVVALDPPLTVVDQDYRRFEIDLDLGDSITGDVGTPPILFDPRGSVGLDDGTTELEVAEVKGLVAAFDALASTFQLDAFADGDFEVPLASITVTVELATELVDATGVEFTDLASFFAALVDGTTVVEVRGLLGADGGVRATEIEIEGQGGIPGVEDLVEVRGRVLNVTFDEGFPLLSGTFEVLIQHIEQGADVAEPIIGGEGSIVVGFDEATLFHAEGEDGLVSAGGLATGQEVEVRFSAFSTSPYPAERVDMDRQESHGTVVSVEGVPKGFTMHLNASEPAVASGAVESSSTDVSVFLGETDIYLDTAASPALSSSQLVNGLEIEVEGNLEGDPSEPAIGAQAIKVRAGRFQGEAMSTEPEGSSFTALAGEIFDPFSVDVTVGTVGVLFAEGVVISGDASNADEFFALFDTLVEGQIVVVDVRGIGTGENAVLAYEVEVEIQD